MLENCVMCNASSTIDQLINRNEFSCDSDSDSNDSNDENSSNVTFFRWQTVEKKITKSKIELGFDDVIEMLKDEIKLLKSIFTSKEGKSVCTKE